MPRHYSGKRQRDLKHVEPHASGYISLLYWIGTITTGCILIFCGKQHCFNDAMAHWARILQIRAGNIIPVFSDEYHDWVVYRDHGKIITFNNTAVNAPFVYFPSLIVRGNFRVSSVATLIYCRGNMGSQILCQYHSGYSDSSYHIFFNDIPDS